MEVSQISLYSLTRKRTGPNSEIFTDPIAWSLSNPIISYQLSGYPTLSIIGTYGRIKDLYRGGSEEWYREIGEQMNPWRREADE